MKNSHWKIDPISLFSHELKTPLSSIRLGLSLLEKDFEKHKSMLPLIMGEVDRIVDFITDNLDLRYIQEKKDMFQFEWKTFGPILSKVCSSLSLTAEAENITFCIKEPKSDNFEIFMDPSWFSCLLENLLSNAIKFSPKDSKIFIEYSCDNKEGFVFSVRDEGQGIPDSKKVFDPFYKSPLPLKKNLKNTGLGLSIAKAIVEAHGGSISAFSESQTKGASFRFVLPKVRLLKQSA